MTSEEAIKVLKDMIPKTCKMVNGRYVGGFEDTECPQFEAVQVAVEAIEKQMPIKPIKDTANLTDFKTFHCPICNKNIVSRLDGEWIAGRPQKHCDDCGQKLDWSDTNDL